MVYYRYDIVTTGWNNLITPYEKAELTAIQAWKVTIKQGVIKNKKHYHLLRCRNFFEYNYRTPTDNRL